MELERTEMEPEPEPEALGTFHNEQRPGEEAGFFPGLFGH